MRYVIVSVVKGQAGDFNNDLRKEVYSKFKARSSKLPAHFTIKAPFEYDGDISGLEKAIEEVCNSSHGQPYNIKGYNHFDNRVIYMAVNMSKEGQLVHDNLIDAMEKFPYMEFRQGNGKDKIFHVTVSSKKIQSIYNDLWHYVNTKPCQFKCIFDNVSIYKWQDNTWKLYREFLIK